MGTVGAFVTATLCDLDRPSISDAEELFSGEDAVLYMETPDAIQRRGPLGIERAFPKRSALIYHPFVKARIDSVRHIAVTIAGPIRL